MDFFEQNVKHLAKSSNEDNILAQIRKLYETSCDVQAKLMYATNYTFDHLDKIKNEESFKAFHNNGLFSDEFTTFEFEYCDSKNEWQIFRLESDKETTDIRFSDNEFLSVNKYDLFDTVLEIADFDNVSKDRFSGEYNGQIYDFLKLYVLSNLILSFFDAIFDQDLSLSSESKSPTPAPAKFDFGGFDEE